MKSSSTKMFLLGSLMGVGAGLALQARSRHQRSIRGQIVLITGGSRGLGLALVREFAKYGCKIAICARDPEELAIAQRKLLDEGIRIFTVGCDVSDETQVQSMVNAVIAHY